MARCPKPWLRKGRGWFVTLNGKQHFLSRHKKEAFAKFYELMSRSPPLGPASSSSLVVLFDRFLDWISKHRAKATYVSYRDVLQSFVNVLPEGLAAAELKPFHLQQWLDDNSSWSSTTGHSYVTTIQRALNWSVKMGHISVNPIAHFEKPPKEPRDETVTEAEYLTLLQHIEDAAFADLLTLHWESGCRPQESLRVEAAFVDTKNARWVFPVRKSKGKKRPRIVYLSDRALDITSRQMHAFPEGPIFRNTHGRPWTKDAVGCRFSRLEKHVGRRYCLYLFRHAFANRMLEAGLDSLSVALLLGHANPAMLSTTYQALNHNPEHLLGQLKKGLSG